MKKISIVLLTIIIIGLVICGCYFWYKSATKMPETTSNASNTTTNEVGGEEPNEDLGKEEMEDLTE